MNNAVASASISTGEMILFFCLAVSMVVVAIYGLLITRRAVYTVISTIFVMVGFAFLYTMLEAPFMGVAQVVVYTGAILMMFLFVLMLIGVDPADSSHETVKGIKPLSVIAGLGMTAMLVGVIIAMHEPEMVGLELANAETNPVGVAQLIFSNHVLTLEVTGALLIVAALGAMTLTHRDAVFAKKTQEELAHERMRAFTRKGVHPGGLPNAGVFAESNSSTNPALTAYGEPLENSVNHVLKIRGQERRVAEISPATVARLSRGEALSGPGTYGVVSRTQIDGMPGEAAPDHELAAVQYAALDAATAKDELESAPVHELAQEEEK